MLGILFALFISIGFPLVTFVYAFRKKRYIPFLLGMFAFLSSQLFLRIPLLDYLSANSMSFIMFQAMQPIPFAILIGFSAGVFEEVARFILMKYCMKKRDWKAGFYFGAGHGGIEAIIFVGVSAISILFTSPTIHIHTLNFTIGGFERLFAILLHIGLSTIVLKAVIQNKRRYLLLAIMIHGFVDMLVGILPLFMPPNTALIWIELSLAIIALGVFKYSLFIKKRSVLK